MVKSLKMIEHSTEKKMKQVIQNKIKNTKVKVSNLVYFDGFLTFQWYKDFSAFMKVTI